ncbi:hypothetical protein TPHA_0C01070 [Tetrapisispora phaffii CBS 4417]|uniref:Palmitoyltransferase n=1 Tax=Tetrapisispora phaffii (strain ATCC 24235 / CBS 4417 / NBRC 1672 / NRRL Y-8282 / UCD 70-5) TaxID=1071381 RepID=G8BR87_TETPH|nr:hypothetical protein TPHA_0C01070 [Tetrapisispora phaffii CBS 4417]CCE62263.1 hypothetical protein TPHA_0C01070 [Tetrapisispora phaffii CBS 4417]
MWFQVICLVVLQVTLLLLSPFLKNRWPFSVYYRRLYVPYLKDVNSYKWKYHVVPGFYFSIYLYLVYCYYAKVEYLIVNHLNLFERGILLPLLIVLTPSFGILTMVTKPINIHGNGISQHDKLKNKFPFDNIIYHSGNVCSTCNIEKPARSKHCNICGTCILLQDHHCIWVNNCIGLGNYKYFFMFLLLNTISLSYAFLRLLHITLSKPDVPKSKNILALCILTGSFSVICGVFFYLQMKQVNNGMTTNETDKWYAVQELMREGKLIKSEDNNWFALSTEDAPDSPSQVYSTNFYDNKTYKISNDYHIVKDASEIPNVYDRGTFLDNLKGFCNE